MRPGKRTFDVVTSVAGLVLLAPVFAAVAAAVWLEGRGKVFFIQQRIGRGGRPFRMWKFRTMVPSDGGVGGLLTIGADPRITPVGGFLRRTKLDELPQLLNVLRGEMSFVGPRPEVPGYVELYNVEQQRALDLTPGITDVASIAFPDEASLLAKAPDPERLYRERIMPAKIRLNLEYASRASLWSDIWVIIRTLGVVAAISRKR